MEIMTRSNGAGEESHREGSLHRRKVRGKIVMLDAGKGRASLDGQPGAAAPHVCLLAACILLLLSVTVVDSHA